MGNAETFAVKYKTRDNPAWGALVRWRARFGQLNFDRAETMGISAAYKLITSIMNSPDCRFRPAGRFAEAFEAHRIQLIKGDKAKRDHVLEVYGDRRGIRYLENAELQQDFIKRAASGRSLLENLATTIAGSQAMVVALYDEIPPERAQKPQVKVRLLVFANSENMSPIGSLKQMFVVSEQDRTALNCPRIVFLLGDDLKLEVIGDEQSPKATQIALHLDLGLGSIRGQRTLEKMDIATRNIPMEDCNPINLLSRLTSLQAREVLRRLSNMEKELVFGEKGPGDEVVARNLIEQLDPERPAEVYYWTVQQIVAGLASDTVSIAVKNQLAEALSDQVIEMATIEDHPQTFVRFMQILIKRQEKEGIGLPPAIKNLYDQFGPDSMSGLGVFPKLADIRLA
jgi:hypothetical protein